MMRNGVSQNLMEKMFLKFLLNRKIFTSFKLASFVVNYIENFTIILPSNTCCTVNTDKCRALLIFFFFSFLLLAKNKIEIVEAWSIWFHLNWSNYIEKDTSTKYITGRTVIKWHQLALFSSVFWQKNIFCFCQISQHAFSATSFQTQLTNENFFILIQYIFSVITFFKKELFRTNQIIAKKLRFSWKWQRR